jgi:hypothetical protein
MKVLLKKYLTNFDHLICSSREQKILWGDFYNGEVSEILDFHSEVPFVEFSPRNSDGLGFMWEGLPYTLNHIIELQDLLNTYPRSRLCILTRFDSKMILNRFFDINVAKLVQAKLPQNTRSIEVLPWSIENLSVVSHKSNFGVIPIQTGISYDHLKAENRLLIMWRLGLPTITGPLPSYKRLQESIGIQFVCENKHDWSRIIKNFLDNPELTGEYMKRAQEYIKSTHSDEILLRKWDLALVPKSRSDSFSLLAP